MEIINYLSFDIEDWFQVENFKGYISKSDWDKYNPRVFKNTLRILDILSCFRTRATFFVLGWVAKKCPDLIIEIDRHGHEVASHGYWHNLVYNQTRQEFKEDIKKSKDILETIIQKEVVGYRAPSFSITKHSLWAIDILHECGFKYDSSIFPTSFHNRYGLKRITSKIIMLKNGIIEFPISTIELLKMRFPLGGGGYFRLLPYSCFKLLSKILNNRGESFIFYLHPWELDEGQPRVNAPFFYKFRHYINLKHTENKLKRLLQDFKFQPFKKIVNSCHFRERLAWENFDSHPKTLYLPCSRH